MTSFSDKLLWISPMRQRLTGQPREEMIQSWGVEKCDSITNKIQNSICFILQATDFEDMDKSTKYLALSIFYRCLAAHFSDNDEQLGLLTLCSLRLAAKFNQIQPKCLVFEDYHYIELINTTLTIPQILSFEIQLFSEMGFKIYIKSPYEYLAEFVKELNLTKKFYNTASSYIDFALTFFQLAQCNAYQIFVGAIYAFLKSNHIKEKRVVTVIQEIVRQNLNGEIVGNVIFQKFVELLQQQQ